jgi:hypothetical protein
VRRRRAHAGSKNTQGDYRLGIDIGRVLIDGSAHPAGGDTAFFAGDEASMLAWADVERLIERSLAGR